VSTKNWTSERPSQKLGYQNEGPYEVVEKVGHSYRLKLPDSNKLHDEWYVYTEVTYYTYMLHER
jgi:hypothetical protein